MRLGKTSKGPTWLRGLDDPFCHVMHHLQEPDLLLAELLDIHSYSELLRPKAEQPAPFQVKAGAC